MQIKAREEGGRGEKGETVALSPMFLNHLESSSAHTMSVFCVLFPTPTYSHTSRYCMLVVIGDYSSGEGTGHFENVRKKTQRS